MAAGSTSGRTACSTSAIGDGGGARRPDNNAQNLNVLLGKMLRIDPRSDAFPADPLRDYAIPAGNPFAQAGGRPEIWAYGLRNPFRASFDPLTQNLWIGDVGQDAREEIDLMRPTDGGANFGWRIIEGTALFNGPPIPAWCPPVAEYLHGARPARGQFGDRRLRLSRAGRGAARPLYLRRLHHRQHLVDPGRAGQPRARPSRAASSSCATPISRPMRGRSTTSPASASTRPAISTSSISTARFSGSSR